MVILHISHQLQLRKQLGTNKLDFDAAFEHGQSLCCCVEHARGPVVGDLHGVRAGRLACISPNRVTRWIGLSEAAGGDSQIETGGRVSLMSPIQELVFFRL